LRKPQKVEKEIVKKTGLLMALLAIAGSSSLEAIDTNKIKGDQCRLISEYVHWTLQEVLGEAIHQAHLSKKRIRVPLLESFMLKEHEHDLGALSLLYTISNPYGLIVMITPEEVVVEKQTA